MDAELFYSTAKYARSVIIDVQCLSEGNAMITPYEMDAARGYLEQKIIDLRTRYNGCVPNNTKISIPYEMMETIKCCSWWSDNHTLLNFNNPTRINQHRRIMDEWDRIKAA